MPREGRADLHGSNKRTQDGKQHGWSDAKCIAAAFLHGCIPAYRHTGIPCCGTTSIPSDNRNMLQQQNLRKYETETQSRLRSASDAPAVLCAASCLLQHISTSVQLVGRGTKLSMVNRSRCATLTRRLEAHRLWATVCLSCLFVYLLSPNENHQTQHATDR